VEQTLQELLEAEMDEALQSSKDEGNGWLLQPRTGDACRPYRIACAAISARALSHGGLLATSTTHGAPVAPMLEMYVQGVSTLKLKTHHTEEVCGDEFSSSTRGRIVQKLGEELERFAPDVRNSRIRI
jgi:transposase-like protein